MSVGQFFVYIYPFDYPSEYLEFLIAEAQDCVLDDAAADGVTILPGPMYVRRVEGLPGEVGYRLEWPAAK